MKSDPIDLLLLNAGAILYNTEVLLKKARLLAKIYLKNKPLK